MQLRNWRLNFSLCRIEIVGYRPPLHRLIAVQAELADSVAQSSCRLIPLATIGGLFRFISVDVRIEQQ